MNARTLRIGAGTLILGLALATPAHAGTTSLAASDEAAIRAILTNESGQATARNHVAPDLDWENAFGIRYDDLEKRDAFFNSVVRPLQKKATDETIEIKVRAVAPDVAVADEYWHVVGQLDVATHETGPDRWGRTTYVFTRSGGAWTLVLERVADLRSPYYHHYDALPPGVALSADALGAMAGTYSLGIHGTLTLQRDGARFAVTDFHGHARVGIPVSPTEVLLFDPADLAEYGRITFGPTGPVLSNDSREFQTPLTKTT